jgi:cell division protein FtsA
MHGFRLDADTHIITATATSIQNLAKCVRAVGIDIDDLVLESLASAEAVLTPEEREAGVMLADIGGGTTDIAIFKENSIYHTAVLPIAGYQISRDIAVGLGLSFELAEEMKKKYGDVNPFEQTEPSDKKLTDDGHSVSYQELSQIILFRVEELLRLMMMELPATNYDTLVPAGVVLTGGSVKLPGMADLAGKVTRLPVRIGTPPSLPGVSDFLHDPASSTGVGLLLWKMRNQGTRNFRPKRNGFVDVASRLFKLFK